jgi:hypothetical protein
VEDKIMKIGEFEKFLVDKIKVDNKVGRCHDQVNLKRRMHFAFK